MIDKLDCINGHVNFYNKEGRQLGLDLPEKCILCFSVNRNRIVIKEEVEKIIDEDLDSFLKHKYVGFDRKQIESFVDELNKRIGELNG